MPPSQVTVQGPIDAVPCSHCGQPQDLRELEAVERGLGFACDECGKVSEIVDLRKIVVLRQA